MIWEHLGRTYEELGWDGKALEAYEKSLLLEPGREELLDRVRALRDGVADSEKQH